VATGQSVAAQKTAAAADEGADHRDRLQHALGDGLKIRRLLGRGGFAEVWSAFDVRLKREVAVKTLRYDLVLSETLLQRFQREAEAVAKLRHPNIIPIYEVGEGSGLAYFVMPMIEGESLGDAADREGTFSIEETCRILRETAGALAAAHRAGIVHRDIKPDNIMLEGPERRPIVMDFGIAKATSGGDAKLTGTGMAMGTPTYMSPEQAAGETNLGPASDQYALALVGYRMLAGRLPFQADTMSTMILKQITETPKPVHQVRTDVPRELSDALARALSKDPNARFANMGEFAAAIPHVGMPSGGVSSTGRRRPTATELARFPGARMPSWREPAVLIGVVGFIASIAFYPMVRPRAALGTAANKGDALFAARAFLTKQGANGSYDEKMSLISDDTAYVWLQRTLGTAAADTRSLSDVPTYWWNLRWQRSASTGPDEVWNAGAAPNGQIIRFRRAIPDTAPGAALTTDSARRIATNFLRDNGVDVTSLTRVQDSMVPRAKRTDYVFAWEARNRRIAGATGDTATPGIRVIVTGNVVQDFRSSLQIPKSKAQRKTSAWRNAGLVVVFIACAVLIIGAVVIAVQRQRTDELQWKVAGRLAIATIVLAGIRLFANPGGLNADAVLTFVVAFTFLGGIVLAGLVVGVVAGETLANESNRQGLVGLESLSRANVRSPEWPAATARGFAIAGILAATTILTRLAAMQILWRGAWKPDGIDDALLWSFPITQVGLALLATVPLFFAVNFIARYTRLPWIAILVPAVVVGVMSLDTTTRPWVLVLEPALILAVLSWTVWRYGFLTAAIAFWASEAFTAAVAFVAIGNGGYVPAAGVCITALLALPAVVLISRRRVAAT
jgi:serine/threonine-protein kinase